MKHSDNEENALNRGNASNRDNALNRGKASKHGKALNRGKASKHNKVVKVKRQPRGTPFKLSDGKWLDKKGKNTNGGWPPHQGFEVSRRRETIKAEGRWMQPGEELDRWGGWLEEVRTGFARTHKKNINKRKLSERKLSERKFNEYKFRDLGFFMSCPGIPLNNRSMPNTEAKIYSVYIVLKPFAAIVGPAAAYYGCEGGAPQILAPRPIEDLIKEGYLKCVRRDL